MDWPTIIVASIIGALLVLIAVRGIINKKKGKRSCSCGGSCSACGMNCHGNDNEK